VNERKMNEECFKHVFKRLSRKKNIKKSKIFAFIKKNAQIEVVKI